MTKITRREFLRSLAAGAGALALDQFLTACGQKELLTTPTATQEQIPTSPPQATSTQPSPTATAGESAEPPQATEAAEPSPSPSETPQGPPDLAVAQGGEPEDLVRRVLAALGGMEKFVSPGAKVIIKPNMCVSYHTYEYAATTNPWVVGALVKMCLEAGAASVMVMDAPFGGTAQEAYAISGIQDQVKAAGGEMAYMPGFKYVSVDIPNGQDLRKVEVFDDVLKADVLINVPIAKHHNLARLTIGMKNLMGVIKDRQAMHRNLGQRLADLSSLVKPTLTVVDAVRILTNHGPTGGNLADVKKLDTVIASQDIVAADSFAATLFGLQPEDLDYIRAATAMGIGRSDLGSLRIEQLPG